jgi:septum formation protein
MTNPSLILASTSPTRQRLLRAAGVSFEVQPAAVEEEVLKAEFHHLSPPDLAAALARAKALSLAKPEHDWVILGADQVLALDETAMHKAASVGEAREKLLTLRGRTHQLHSAVACAAGETIVFEYIATAELTMRNFSDHFLEHYLTSAGDAILGSVGCYYYEGLGLQLFEKVEGDYHTILGLPVLPVLAFLRQSSIVPA